MPKADATELAPKKSAYRNPPALHPCWRVSGFWPPADQRFLKSAHFFGEAPQRRPWAIKRENRPAAFAGRSKSRPLGPSGRRDTAVAYTAKYPIPPRIIYRHLQRATPAGNLRNQPEIIVRTPGATTVGHYNPVGSNNTYRICPSISTWALPARPMTLPKSSPEITLVPRRMLYISSVDADRLSP